MNNHKIIVFRNGELQLSANKNTRFNFRGIKKEFAKRDIVSFKHIWSDTFSPLFGELDFVGVVITHGNKDNDTNNEVYVSDKEMNIVSILFRSNIKVIALCFKYYLDNVYTKM